VVGVEIRNFRFYGANFSNINYYFKYFILNNFDFIILI
jgi:hypothetical protein